MNAALQNPPYLQRDLRLNGSLDRNHIYRNEGYRTRLQVRHGEDGGTQFGQREYWQGKVKSAALSQLAFHPDSTTVPRHQLSCNEQPQTQTTATCWGTTFYLRQTVKDHLAVFRADSTSRIGHREAQKAVVFREGPALHGKGPTFGRELDSVVDQVDEYLTHTDGVGPNEGETGRNLGAQ